MSSIIDNKSRNVFPKWRKYEDALKKGELDPIAYKDNTKFINKITNEFDYFTIKNWNNHKTIGLAADILNFAVMHNSLESSIAFEASKYVLDNEHKAGYLLVDLAKSIVENNGDNN